MACTNHMCTFYFAHTHTQMLFSSKADNLLVRLRHWWNFSLFNRIDLAILVLAMLGFVLRLVPGYFIASKNVYAVNCVLLFLRVLREYSASSFLGPKLVMIARMVGSLLRRHVAGRAVVWTRAQ